MTDDDASAKTLADPPVECPCCQGTGTSDGSVTVSHGCCVACRGTGRLSMVERAAWLEAMEES